MHALTLPPLPGACPALLTQMQGYSVDAGAWDDRLAEADPLSPTLSAATPRRRRPSPRHATALHTGCRRQPLAVTLREGPAGGPFRSVARTRNWLSSAERPDRSNTFAR